MPQVIAIWDTFYTFFDDFQTPNANPVTGHVQGSNKAPTYVPLSPSKGQQKVYVWGPELPRI